jgi:hypothetical protein
MGCDIPRIVAILPSFLLDRSTPEDKGTKSARTLETSYPATQLHIPKYLNPQAHRHETFHKIALVFILRLGILCIYIYVTYSYVCMHT